LAPNTRRNHAARHGDIFTPTEQAEWWDSGSNRLNCQCTVVDVLVDKKTGEVLQTSLHQKAVKQGKEYFKEVGTAKK
jgi:hypothetical protein